MKAIPSTQALILHRQAPVLSDRLKQVLSRRQRSVALRMERLWSTLEEIDRCCGEWHPVLSRHWRRAGDRMLWLDGLSNGRVPGGIGDGLYFRVIIHLGCSEETQERRVA